MTEPQITYLPDGQRLHLHHGPIDMIVGVTGPGRAQALRRAAQRFESLLTELVAELPRLRAQTGPALRGETARRMQAATGPYHPAFITPMAAVAGAGADTILRALCDAPGVDRAYVNNGGDVALFLTPGQSFTAAIASSPAARINIAAHEPSRGIATSGWRGRSQSFGIADSVTVLARTAAQADAAATMIANAVNLPNHPAITRQPANLIAPDSDLGARPVTVDVAPLSASEIATALDNGVQAARDFQSRGLIDAAALMLGGDTRLIGPLSLTQQKAPAHA